MHPFRIRYILSATLPISNNTVLDGMDSVSATSKGKCSFENFSSIAQIYKELQIYLSRNKEVS